jgi:glycosyltransferase involved in cell wall biosynthesis
MRILYLLYAQQNDFADPSVKARSKFPWANVLLENLEKRSDITLALGFPINSIDFQMRKENGIMLYGLPNPVEKNFFKKMGQRISRSPENASINDYVSLAIDDFKPDVIQIFGSENPFGLIIEKQKIPVIIHIQGYLNVWQGKWFTSISKSDQLRYAGLKDLALMVGSFNEFFDFKKRAAREEIILRNCRYFMGRTPFDKRIASLLSKDSEYFHCEEFIRPVFFEKQWNIPTGTDVNCISILKGTSYKGIDLLVETAIILKRFTNLTFTLKICGVSEGEEIVQIIRKKYSINFKSLNIRFLGRLASDDLVEQLCNSTFYIHPSFIENSPNSVCEAMALGMPVISTNVGGVGSMISDGVDGILVQEGEPYSMAAAIYDLINNYEYAKLLGENARKRSTLRHDPDQIVKQLLGIYETIFNNNDRRQ